MIPQTSLAATEIHDGDCLHVPGQQIAHSKLQVAQSDDSWVWDGLGKNG